MSEETSSKKKPRKEVNKWVISTIAFGVVVLIFLISNILSLSGHTISEKDAGNYLLTYFEGQGISGAELLDVETEGNFYKVTISYQGSEVPFYVTKDGYLAGYSLVSIIPEEETSTTLTKSIVPEASLYIWSYCPYGVTALGPFAEVAKLLGDTANFKVYLYYAGHGDFEEQQNKIQACIQDLGYKDEYWNYAQKFVEEIYPKITNSSDTCYKSSSCDLDLSTKLMNSVGIDSAKVLSCMNTKGDALLEEDYSSAQDNGISGSPSLVINGIYVSAARNAEAYKSAVCSAYTTAPEQCGEALSSTGSTASGNC